MYDPKEIRTGNMLPDRSTDLDFTKPDEDGVIPESLTQQHFTDECDVNRIVRSHSFQPADLSMLQFADVSEFVGYTEALAIVQKANDSFAALDAEIRKRFDNNPANMVNFLADPENVQEAIKLGLMVETNPNPSQPEKQTPKASDEPQA